VLIIGMVAYMRVNRRQAQGLDDYGAAPSWTLTDQAGRQVSWQQLEGQVIVANFIYTHCPDICPLLSTKMQFLQERLREKGLLDGRVVLLSFTTDPRRDTPTVLKTYSQRYHADADHWHFLTGPEAEIRRIVVEGFKLGVEKAPVAEPTHGGHEEYDVLHSKRFVLIDQQGRIRALYDGTELDTDQVVDDIEGLLR
jgi:protein SCO1/2